MNKTRRVLWIMPLLLGAAVAGCELIANVDREEIPKQLFDAGGVPDGEVSEDGAADAVTEEGPAPGDAGSDALVVDSASDQSNDAAADVMGDQAIDQQGPDAAIGPDAPPDSTADGAPVDAPTG